MWTSSFRPASTTTIIRTCSVTASARPCRPRLPRTAMTSRTGETGCSGGGQRRHRRQHDGMVCYVDVDGDGYASSDATVESDDAFCTGPGEATSDLPRTDCDDDSAASSGATEVMGDGVDSDCNGEEVCLDVDDDGTVDALRVPPSALRIQTATIPARASRPIRRPTTMTPSRPTRRRGDRGRRHRPGLQRHGDLLRRRGWRCTPRTGLTMDNVALDCTDDGAAAVGTPADDCLMTRMRPPTPGPRRASRMTATKTATARRAYFVDADGDGARSSRRYVGRLGRPRVRRPGRPRLRRCRL